MKFCIDCGCLIVGKAVLISSGDSMSGARPSTYAHPSASPECQPPGHRSKSLRRALAGVQELRPHYY